MIEMKAINARINEIKGLNKTLKENPDFDNYHISQFYMLRNLINEVNKELEMNVLQTIWSYHNPTEQEGFSVERIRENSRRMINEANKLGLDNLRIDTRINFDVNGHDFFAIISNKTNLTGIQIMEVLEDGIYDSYYEKRYDNTLDMLSDYFDIVDSDYQIIKDKLPLSVTEVAKQHGFVFDDDVYYDTDDGFGNGYLMATETLLNKADAILKQELSPEAYQNYLDALESGDSTPNFYAQYSIDTGSIELVATAHYIDEKGIGNFQEFEIPTTEDEKDILFKALNEYCLEKYNQPFVIQYDASMEPGRSLEQLDELAMELYNKHSRDFSEFSNGELYELYKNCLITENSPYPPVYDDEVFDEIGRRQPVEGKSLIDVYQDKLSDEEIGRVKSLLKSNQQKKEKAKNNQYER